MTEAEHKLTKEIEEARRILSGRIELFPPGCTERDYTLAQLAWASRNAAEHLKGKLEDAQRERDATENDLRELRKNHINVKLELYRATRDARLEGT